MPDRSELGDLIVEHGMFVEGLTRLPKLARALDNVPHLAELRDELIRLRRIEDAFLKHCPLTFALVSTYPTERLPRGDA